MLDLICNLFAFNGCPNMNNLPLSGSVSST